jgi:hypothetical protein
MPAASSGASRPLPVAATAGVRMADVRMMSQVLYRQVRRIRVPCGDRRLRRECARTARIGERRQRGPAYPWWS